MKIKRIKGNREENIKGYYLLTIDRKEACTIIATLAEQLKSPHSISQNLACNVFADVLSITLDDRERMKKELDQEEFMKYRKERFGGFDKWTVTNK